MEREDESQLNVAAEAEATQEDALRAQGPVAEARRSDGEALSLYEI
jgi:hypothetical protein